MRIFLLAIAFLSALHMPINAEVHRLRVRNEAATDQAVLLDEEADFWRRKLNSQMSMNNSNPTLLGLLKERPNSFSMLIDALELGNVSVFYDNPEGTPRTLFAPTNEAFGRVQGLEKYFDPIWGGDHLRTLSLAHTVFNQTIRASQFEDGFQFDLFSIEDQIQDPFTINVTPPTPPTISSVFTPLPAEIVEFDMEAASGIFHSIDQVMIPVNLGIDPVTLAVLTDQFSTILELLDIAELTVFVSTSDGPLTMFFPPDPVFEDPGIAPLLPTLKNNTELLRRLLLNHVVEDTMLDCGCVDGSFDPVNMTSADGNLLAIIPTTGNSTSLSYSVNGIATVDGFARVLASNGVIGVIAGLLLPPGFLEELNAQNMFLRGKYTG